MNFEQEKILELHNELFTRKINHIVSRNLSSIGVHGINNTGMVISYNSNGYQCDLYKIEKSDKRILEKIKTNTIPQEIRDRIRKEILPMRTKEEIIDYLIKGKIIYN